jgi:polyisoprenoid-binding protein YceI
VLLPVGNRFASRIARVLPPPLARPGRVDAVAAVGSAMRTFALGLLLAAVASFAPAVQGQGVLVDKSDIRFYTKQLGVTVEGRFRKWNADVDFRADDPARSRVAFRIDLGSIDFASDETEKEMQRPGWFDSVKFPEASFVSSGVKDLGAGRYDISGRFTLKGLTQDIVVPVRVANDSAGYPVARGEFTLKRLQFTVGDGPWNDTSVVADDVLVRVRLTLPRTGS